MRYGCLRIVPDLLHNDWKVGYNDFDSPHISKVVAPDPSNGYFCFPLTGKRKMSIDQAFQVLIQAMINEHEKTIVEVKHLLKCLKRAEQGKDQIMEFIKENK